MADQALVDELNRLLGNHAVFYQKLRNYHWNVTGPAFFQLHEKFEEMYLRTAEEVDGIAERLTAMSARPASTLGEFLELADIDEDRDVPESTTMVEHLVEDLHTLVEVNRSVKSKAAGVEDDTTVNLLDDIADQLEEDAWMLRAWRG